MNALNSTSTRQNIMTMTYEQYLDEITTLIYEKYDVTEAEAVKYVVRAQAAEFFSKHDETPSMRTPEQAALDAKTVYEERNKSKPSVFRK
jgi:CRISPR/Cas system-associated protein Cas7 (RAMP superfamily)